MRSITRLRLTGLVLAATAVATAPVSAFAGLGSRGETGSLSTDQRKLITAATKHLKSPAAARAAGYVPAGECTEVPGLGGMGVHYIKPQLAMDTLVDPSQPEFLLFEPTASGGHRLVGVEYLVADADQDLNTAGDRPSLFGEHPFSGPMPGHGPDMPVHYDLHVWLYEHSPSGQLSDWNPRVTCTPKTPQA